MARDDILELLAYAAALGHSFLFRHDGAESIDELAVQKDVQLDQLSRLVSQELVIKRGISPGPRLERIEEVIDYFVQRHLIVELYSCLGQVLHVDHVAAPVLAK